VTERSGKRKLISLRGVVYAVGLAWVAARCLPLETLLGGHQKTKPLWTMPKPSPPNLNAPFGHPYFPYSVIPGGAYTREELAKALAGDPVAARHYAGFDLSKARVVRLDSDRYCYVSYRVGDKIYWTNHTLPLPKGEKVLTDGVHYAGTRCGNRLSDRPLVPKTPAVQQEPLAKQFNAPVIVQIASTFRVPELDPPPDLPIGLGGINLPGLSDPLAQLLPPPEEPQPPLVRQSPPDEHRKPFSFAPDGPPVLSILPTFYPTETPPVPNVPEPGTAALGGLALIGLGLIGRRMAKH
jgi:PEP-CTERM motif